MPTAATIIGSSYREKGWDYNEVETPRSPRQRDQGSEKGGYFEDWDRNTANLKSRWERNSHSVIGIPPSPGYRPARSRSLSISRTWPSSSVSSSPEFFGIGGYSSSGQNMNREYLPHNFGGYVAVDSLHYYPENDLRMGLQRLGLASTSALPDPSTNRTRRKAAGNIGRRSKSSLGRAESPVRPQYKEVHCLILTWPFHDLRADDYTDLLAVDYVSLEDESELLIKTLKDYGWKVSEYHIDMNRPIERTTARLNNFCQLAADDVLLVVYYHGHGSLSKDSELVFSSHDHPENSEWAKKAAADLYSELLSCQNSRHGQKKAASRALMKYERYRPISNLPWSTLRQPLLTCPSDVFFILDCCAAGGANLPSSFSSPQSNTYTKHLFAACGFESSTTDDMTATLCSILDENATAGNNGTVLTTKRLHQLMEERLQKKSNEIGTSQPIFKQLLPLDPERKIHLPKLTVMGNYKGRRGRRSRRGTQGHASMNVVLRG
ncbi:uncharacterized protein QC763_0038110 [Podospora pseudopauciseta]|uniref:Uncharacterized protein n=1 Tax=Podospora pseudopauciseta TaxID=2093780 RepID=A0ABR0HQ26_9PEZI|nr:hypothetical protein QC763_0038110 [Podospora pseudopauciseta]